MVYRYTHIHAGCRGEKSGSRGRWSERAARGVDPGRRGGGDAAVVERRRTRTSLPIEDKGLESKPLKCSTNLGFRVRIVEPKPLLFSSRDLCLNELEIS
jgi:hypothetical protein